MLTLRSSAVDMPGVVPEQLVSRDAVRVCRCGASLPLQVRLGLRSRSRPVLEGQWTCSARCLERQVATMVQREMQTMPVRRTYRHRIPLGLLLLSNGAVKKGDLQRALTLQQGTGERLGDVLQRECGLSDRTLADALAVQWGCGVSTEIALHAESAARVAPQRMLTNTGMLPVRLSREGRMHVAFADVLDAQAIFALQRMHRVPVTAGIAPIGMWTKGHARVAQAEGVAVDEIECDDAAALEREIVRAVRTLQPVESRFVRAHDQLWLRLWLETAALAGGPSQQEDVQDLVFRVAPSKQTDERQFLRQ